MGSETAAMVDQERESAHRPVMLAEVVAWLAPRPGGRYVDGTVGGGGHTEALLEAASPGGLVIGLDRDAEAVERVRARLSGWGEAVRIVHAKFSEMREVVRIAGLREVDGVLLDLGWSSDQLEDAKRGFSFRAEGPLDMRLDRRQNLTAAALLAESSEDELARILRELGGEPFARRIARAIVEERQRAPLETTGQLSRLVVRAVPPRARHRRRHVATRVFQALRMAVNQELEELELGLEAALSILRSGRLVVISFHSGEDRVVKRAFSRWRKAGRIRVLTPKPLEPSTAEIRENPRARSAKLRVAEVL